MKKFSFFSLFFLRECNRNVTRSHKKTSACLCVKAPRQDIFDSREKKKKKTTRDEFDHDRQKSQTTLSFIYRSTEKDDTNGRTISGGYGATGTATLAMTTATTDTLQVLLLKRGKRCSRRKSKCIFCVLIFFFFAHRETNTQRNPQREGKTNISLMKTFVFVASCAP